MLLVSIVNIFSNSILDSDDMLVKKLKIAGVDHVLAEKLVVFMPIVFARLVIEKICKATYSNYFLVELTDGEWIEWDYRSDEVFIFVSNLLEVLPNIAGVNERAFTNIAKRSPELAAVNELFANKKSNEEIRCSPVQVFRLKYDDLISSCDLSTLAK